MDKFELMTKLRRSGRDMLIVLATLGLGAIAIWGFIKGREELALEAERERPVKAPQRISLEGGEPVITLDAAAQEQSGLRTVALQQTQYHEQLRAYATVLDLQPLVDLDNSYAVAKAQLKGAQAKLDASSAEFDREEALFKTKTSIVTLDKLQAVEAAFHVDEAALTSAEAQLRTINETAELTWGTVLGRQFGEENPMFARLVQRQDYLIQVTLPPGVLVANPPATASIQLENGARKDIDFISPTTKTNVSIQGMSFFYKVAASSDLLPNMNVLAFLPLETTVDGVVVPGPAVVWWQGQAWVYVRTSPSTFARRAIATDYALPEGGYLVRTFTGGTEVVVQGAQMLLSEEFRAQIQVGEESEGK
ncbi:MAG: multidrug transporter [Methyloceanibacter sp.]|nr:multidrug transporter [Methyloceanibacter sp.]